MIRALSLAVATGALTCGALALYLPREDRGPRTAHPPTAAVAANTPAAADSPSTPIPLVATTPAEVRIVVLACRGAGPDDADWLRDVALRSPDPLVAGNALRALGGIVSLAEDAELTALLTDPRPRLRQEAVIALGRSRDPAALPLLEQVLERGEPGTAPLAIQALGRLGGSRAREAIGARLEDPRSTEVERTFARSALRTMR